MGVGPAGRARVAAGFLIAAIAGVVGAGIAREAPGACRAVLPEPVYVLPEVEVIGR